MRKKYAEKDTTKKVLGNNLIRIYKQKKTQQKKFWELT